MEQDNERSIAGGRGLGRGFIELTEEELNSPVTVEDMMLAEIESIRSELRPARTLGGDPLLLSFRAADQLLNARHGTARGLVQRGLLAPVRVGKRQKVRRAQVEYIAATGWDLDAPKRPKARQLKAITGGRAAAVRALKLSTPRARITPGIDTH